MNLKGSQKRSQKTTFMETYIDFISKYKYLNLSLLYFLCLRFLDYLGELEDVYVMSMREAIEWVKDPTFLSDLSDFQPWIPRNCRHGLKSDTCPEPRECVYEVVSPLKNILTRRGFLIQNQTETEFSNEKSENELVYLTSCIPCPPEYPDYNNPYGMQFF
jgi:hypothetical protein